VCAQLATLRLTDPGGRAFQLRPGKDVFFSHPIVNKQEEDQ
jgi:hypothetical protein